MTPSSSHVSLAPVLLLAQLEALIHKVLDYSPATRLRLTPLAGRVAHLALTLPRVDIFIEFVDERVRLSQHCELSVAVRIEGSAPALLRQLSQPGQFRAGGGVSVEGDIALAQTLSDIARRIDFDWEALLADRIGDVAAHQIGQTLRWGAGFLGSLTRKAWEDGRRFLVSERPMLVERPDFDRFGNAVTRVRQDYDRLEARVALLKQRARAQPATVSPESAPLPPEIPSSPATTSPQE